MSNKQFVIFKHFNIYKVTSKSNWDEGIMNVDGITTIKDANSYVEAKNAVIKWLGLNECDIINKTGE